MEIAVEATIQPIFLMGYALYDQTHRLPEHIRKATHCLMGGNGDVYKFKS